MTKHLTTKAVHIVFDTSLIFAKTEGQLICQDLKNIINETSDITELKINWYLPSIVIAERKYRMLQRAYTQLEQAKKIEKILGYNLNVTEEILETKIDEYINKEIKANKLLKLELEKSQLNWDFLIESATKRIPPFSVESEKGLRDFLILESYAQLTAKMSDSPSDCRLILVTSDGLLQKAFQEKMSDRANAGLFSDFAQLKSHINILDSALVGEIGDKILPLAAKIFFENGNTDTLYYKEEVLNKIRKLYGNELAKGPTQTWLSSEWHINILEIRVTSPTFLPMKNRKTHWSSKISITVEASKSTTSPSFYVGYLTPPPVFSAKSLADNIAKFGPLGANVYSSLPENPTFSAISGLLPQTTSGTTTGKEEKQKGEHNFDVLWEATLSQSKLTNPTINKINYIDTQWENTPTTKLFENLLSYLSNKSQ